MTTGETVMLVFIITAFVVFSATLAWASREHKPSVGRQQAHRTPIGARHA